MPLKSKAKCDGGGRWGHDPEISARWVAACSGCQSGSEKENQSQGQWRFSLGQAAPTAPHFPLRCWNRDSLRGSFLSRGAHLSGEGTARPAEESQWAQGTVLHKQWPAAPDGSSSPAPVAASSALAQVGKRFLSPPSRHRGLQSVQPDTPRICLWCHSTTPRAHTHTA